MKKTLEIVIFYFAILLIISFSGCKKDPIEIPTDIYVHFPIGQKSISDTDLVVQADSIITKFEIIEDGLGSKWIKVAINKFNLDSRVKIKFTKKAGPPILSKQELPVPDVWLKPSKYIDSDHQAIVQKSNELSSGLKGNITIAKNIQLFVIGHLYFQEYVNHAVESASSTYQNTFGTSINHARLFIALCRAAGIPARSVWGSVYRDGKFSDHHNWAEILDENGFWHPLDLTFTTLFDLDDFRYLDLLYSAEENMYYEVYKIYQKSANGDYFFYDGSLDGYDGRLSISILSNNYPDEMDLSISYNIDKLFED